MATLLPNQSHLAEGSWERAESYILYGAPAHSLKKKEYLFSAPESSSSKQYISVKDEQRKIMIQFYYYGFT
jgi:hypothetical protein